MVLQDLDPTLETEKYNYPLKLSYLPLPKRKCTGPYTRQVNNTQITFSSPQLIPGGKWGDLSAMFLCTAANRLKLYEPGNHKIEFSSIYKILKKFGFNKPNGYQQQQFKEVLDLWTTLLISYKVYNPEGYNIKNISITRKAHILYGDNSNAYNHPSSYIHLTNDAFNFFTDEYMLVKASDIAEIETSFELRIYLWITRRIFNQNQNISIKWKDLLDQFGSSDKTHNVRFKRDFEDALNDIGKRFIPHLNFDTNPKKGLLIHAPKTKPSVIKSASDDFLCVPSPTLPFSEIGQSSTDKPITYPDNSEKEKAFNYFISCCCNEQFPAPPPGTKAWDDLKEKFEEDYRNGR